MKTRVSLKYFVHDHRSMPPLRSVTPFNRFSSEYNFMKCVQDNLLVTHQFREYPVWKDSIYPAGCLFEIVPDYLEIWRFIQTFNCMNG